MKRLILPILTFLFVNGLSAQDLVYTISGEIGNIRTTLDSILIDNISNSTRLLFDDLPEQTEYHVNLTQKKIILTGINSIGVTESFKVLQNISGTFSLMYLGNNPVDMNIYVYSVNGQLLHHTTKTMSGSGSTVHLKLAAQGVLLIKIVALDYVQTFKALGSVEQKNSVIEVSEITSNQTSTIKNIKGQTSDDFSYNIGDSLRISVYKDGYYAAPVSIEVSTSSSLAFHFIICTTPTVNTLTATSINSNSAILNGYISSDGNTPITEYGFYWSKNETTPIIDDSIAIAAYAKDSFNYTLSGLTPKTTYYYVAYATNEKGTSTGEVSKFITGETQIIQTSPTISTLAATGITESSATLNGDVSSDGNSTITKRGFYWSTDNSPSASDNSVTISGTTGSFSSTLTELTANTTYYYVAYATNSKGTNTGDVYSFTTSAARRTPLVSTSKATNITDTNATLNGNVSYDGNATITERGFYLSITSIPTPNDRKIIVNGTTGNFSSALTGFTANTTYYYVAYATNIVGTGTGEVYSFRTDVARTIPTVNTLDATNLTDSSATLNGNIVYDGNATITRKGFYYSSTNTTPTSSDNIVTVSGTTRDINSTLTNLTPNTTYYYRAYATNSEGTGIGDVYHFITGEKSICKEKLGIRLVSGDGQKYNMSSNNPVVVDIYNVNTGEIYTTSAHFENRESGISECMIDCISLKINCKKGYLYQLYAWQNLANSLYLDFGIPIETEGNDYFQTYFYIEAINTETNQPLTGSPLTISAYYH